MTAEQFDKVLKENNGVKITDDYIVFNDYELYSLENNNSLYFKNINSLLGETINGKTIKDIIAEAEDFTPEDNGGRGASSLTAGGKLFTGKAGREGNYTSGGNLPAAYVNTLTSAYKRSVDSIAKAFGKKMLNETKEYSAALDEYGFATKHNKGGKSSTAHLVQEKGYSIHNHPTKDKNGKTVAWNIYSKADLTNSALDKGRGTIVVSNGNRTMYKFTKTNHFKSKEFIKGLNSAKAKSSNYDKEVDKWLKANQKTYGYKYEKKRF